jgi:hypothetical protein
MTNTYIQDKLDELDDRFAIIIDEKIDDKIYKNIDYGDFYGRRDEFKDFIKEIFVDYHNHIIEKIYDGNTQTARTDEAVAMGIIGTVLDY